jgi:Rrf2 family transcriptional regulator, cysteine metabolism repressor
MKVSTRGRYGVRLMSELARLYGKGPVHMSTMAKNLGISRKYLHAQLTTLKSAGLVVSSRGAEGGYVLARPPSQITVKDIVHTLEGSIVPVECVENPRVCKRAENCVARGVWTELGEAMDKVLSSLTLQQLIERQPGADRRPPTFDI